MSELLNNPESLLEAEIEMHKGLEVWRAGHTNDLLGELEYDRDKYPFQRIDINQYGPIEPSVEFARMGGAALMGEGFENFVNGFSRHIPTIRDRLADSKSTLIATPHIPDVLDTPLVAAAVYSSAGELELAERTIIASGKLMTRISFFGESAVNVLARIGEVDTSIPRSATAQKNMNAELIDYINQSMLYNFARKAREGRIVHQAPTNTRALRTTDGFLYPRVDDATVKFITKFIGFGIPAVVRRSKKDTPAGWYIGEPRQLKTSADVHEIMEELAEKSSDLFGNVEYESEEAVRSRLGSIALNTA